MARAHLHRLGVIHDPYAAGMLHPPFSHVERLMGHPPLDRFGRGGTLAFLAARTLAFDAGISEALDGGVIQVVIVGAGYDSRAWRMARPGVRYFEVDHPATQADKRRVVPPGPGPIYVPVDLAADDPAARLREAGLDVAARAVFAAEGLTMYLAEEQVRGLFGALAAAAGSGSTLVTNFGVGFAPSGSGGIPGLTRRVLVSMRGEPLRYEPSQAKAADLLAVAGWTVTETADGPEIGQQYLTTGAGLATNSLNPAAFVVRATRSDGP